jgi:predicted SAM-dependent methyltransferase
MINQLVLGAGIDWPKQPNQTLVDILPVEGIDLVTDLNEPWPIPSNSYESIIAIHLIEHLKDLLHFMSEAHRVLKPGGTLYIETPIAGEDPDLEFADPTHVRCYRPHTFINYMTIEGIAKFGYTDKCWGSLHIEKRDSVMIIHLMPIK